MALSPRLEFDRDPLFRSQRQHRARDSVRQRLHDGSYALEEVPCFCGDAAGLVIASVDRWRLPVTTVLCPTCGLLRTSPRMRSDSVSQFYRDHFQDLFCDSDTDSLAQRRATALRKQIANSDWLVRFFGRLLPDIETISEVGCGTGGNLVRFAQAGKRVAGCDLGGDFLPAGRDLGLDLIRGGATDLLHHQGAPADLVLLSHVLEHFLDLDQELRPVVELVRPGGLLLVDVPGILSIGSSYHGDILRYLQIPHTYHFTAATLRFVLQSAGLEVLQIAGEVLAVARRPFETAPARRPAPPMGESRSVLRYLAQTEKAWLIGRPQLGTQTEMSGLLGSTAVQA